MGINKDQLLQYVIRPTLARLGLGSPSAENLLLGTCAQESRMGNFLHQVNGPAKGIYQMEPATHDDLWENYLKFNPDICRNVLLIGKCDTDNLVTNLVYATAMARIQYLRAPEGLPAANDISGLARYWKKYYNTPEGAGTEEEFIHNYNIYVLDNNRVGTVREQIAA